MPWRNTRETYGSVAKTLHWLIFLMIAGMLTVGFIMTDMPNSPDKFKLYGLHKSFGISVLALVTLRLLWKAANIQPVLPDGMRVWEKWAAHAGHALLYVLIIAMPFSGWAMSSAAGLPVSVFGWFTVPNLVAPDKALKHDLQELHETLAWVLIVAVTLHVLAALLHHFYYKDNVLRRMLPFCRGNDAQDADSGC
ncbi:MAG: cytochrome b [Pseudomonadota bacterium]|nr:cytochrome b [Pseudomonadota bacterium]